MNILKIPRWIRKVVATLLGISTGFGAGAIVNIPECRWIMSTIFAMVCVYFMCQIICSFMGVDE